MRLQHRVALATGASRGIGRGIAIAFAREGAKAGVNYCASEQQAVDVVGLIRDMGGDADLFHGDVADDAQMV